MKNMITGITVVLTSVLSMATTSQVVCNDTKGSSFLTGVVYLKTIDGEKVPVISNVQILDAKASLRLAKDSANKISQSDTTQYKFKTHPDNVQLVDPTDCLFCFNSDAKQNSYIGKNKKYLEQNFYSEINEQVGGSISMALDYRTLQSGKPFKMTFLYNIDDYESPVNKKLICLLK